MAIPFQFKTLVHVTLHLHESVFFFIYRVSLLRVIIIFNIGDINTIVTRSIHIRLRQINSISIIETSRSLHTCGSAVHSEKGNFVLSKVDICWNSFIFQTYQTFCLAFLYLKNITVLISGYSLQRLPAKHDQNWASQVLPYLGLTPNNQSHSDGLQIIHWNTLWIQTF